MRRPSKRPANRNVANRTSAGRADARSPLNVRLTVLVAALGYFVDIYDLVLFGIVRVASLKSLGVTGDALLGQGVLLLNMQMGGMLVGGILWGIIGDKRGRLSVLFGSIFLYSIANIANGLAQSVSQYAVLRVIAGVGLAGELGAGITLVSELMHKETRGYGTTLIAGVGLFGGVVAGLVGDLAPWRTAYFIGGGLGLVLLALRVGLNESGMFDSVKKQDVSRGNFFAIFQKRERLTRYVSVVLVGLPIWYIVGVLVTFAPELGNALGMPEPPTAGRAILFTYAGGGFGDLASGLLSQRLRSRRKAVGAFLGLAVAAIALYFLVGPLSLPLFYASCSLLGFALGYWAVFVTVASEQFGTNLRATVTTSVPNFVRGATVPITMAFKAGAASLGMVGSAVTVGIVVLLVALISLWHLQETFGKDLDYLET